MLNPIHNIVSVYKTFLASLRNKFDSANIKIQSPVAATYRNLRNEIDFREVIKIPGFHRVKIDNNGAVKVLFRATDPANYHTLQINKYRESGADYYLKSIQPIHAHAANLYFAIRDCNNNDDFRGSIDCDFNWEAVCNHLHMAASVEDVYADTAVVDDSGSTMWCRPAYEFEKAHSETVSKYMAAQIFFNFVWMAYESAVELAGDGKKIKKQTGAKGRVILAASGICPYQIPLLREIFELCVKSVHSDLAPNKAKDVRAIIESLDQPIVELSAEVVRIIRNHVIHGDDPIPYPEDHGGHNDNDIRNPIQRLYYTSRLTLILIQLLALISVEDRHSLIKSSYDDDFDECEDCKYETSIDICLRTLHMLEVSQPSRQMKFAF